MSVWNDVVAGERCEVCKYRAPARLTVTLVRPQQRFPWSPPDWPTHRVFVRSRCIDRAACAARVERARARDARRDRSAARRRVPIRVAEPPSPGGPQGSCQWCGAPLMGKAGRPPARNRLYCHADREGRACDVERANSVVWSARDALKATVPDGAFRCADCDAACARRWGDDGEDWDADHEVPLWAGGAHDLSNLRVRCKGCHREKTAREAADRAARGGRVACDE